MDALWRRPVAFALAAAQAATPDRAGKAAVQEPQMGGGEDKVGRFHRCQSSGGGSQTVHRSPACTPIMMLSPLDAARTKIGDSHGCATFARKDKKPKTSNVIETTARITTLANVPKMPPIQAPSDRISWPDE